MDSQGLKNYLLPHRKIGDRKTQNLIDVILKANHQLFPSSSFCCSSFFVLLDLSHNSPHVSRQEVETKFLAFSAQLNTDRFRSP